MCEDMNFPPVHRINCIMAFCTMILAAVMINFLLICFGCACNYDQEALLAELDSRFMEQRVRINTEVIAILIEQEIAYEITQRKLWSVQNLLTQNQLVEAKEVLKELDGNEHLNADEQFQVTMVLKQMGRTK